MRSGGTALGLLSAPLNVHVLKALEDENRSLTELSQAVGLPPASTLRTYLRKLVEVEVLERTREDGFPSSVTYAITPVGSMLLRVGQVLQRWLEKAPDGPILLGSPAAKSATKALVDGWSTTIVRALAARPLALTELDRLIPQISYPTLERRLTAMRLVGLLGAMSNGSGRATPYRVTRWLREAVPTLTAAVAWERRYAQAHTPRLGRHDIEAGFLLAIPLIELPSEVEGVCRLSVEVRQGEEAAFAGVTVALMDGKPVSCVTRFDREADAWAAGPALDWFRWVNGKEGAEIEFGGDRALALLVVETLRETLVPMAGRPTEL
ncbi:MAG TPA: winged helix-turn-helix transcriptional regulator [Solirubrobacterales bacterium]|nr:winged helix-turn-helix transcriptional regulator [Solirubrobacterales bacterium]